MPPVGNVNGGSSSALSYADIEGYWVANGGPASAAPIAAAIALAESSGIPDIEQQGEPYASTGWGLWQITPGNSEPQIGTDGQLFDPNINAQAAVAKYEAAGNSFSPWTTYTSGAYLAHLQQGVAPTSPANLTGITNIPGDVAGAVAGAGSVAGILGKLLSPTWWRRVGKMGLAVLIGLVAMSYIAARSKTGQTVEKDAGSAATMAAMA